MTKFLGWKMAAALGAVAAVRSPAVRQALHQGAVYGLAELLKVSDRLTAALAESAPDRAPGNAASPPPGATDGAKVVNQDG